MPRSLDPERLKQSFDAAFAGLAHVTHTQPNWRIHLGLATAAILGAVVLGLSVTEWAALILATGLVFAMEAMNTAIEATVDAIPVPRSPVTRHAKDAAAAAVLVAAFAALLVGFALFAPKLAALLLR